MRDSMDITHDFLIEKLKESNYSDSEIELILNGLSAKKITTFRVNILKDNLENIKKVLENLDITYSENKNFPNSIILNDYYQKDKK